MKLNTSWLVFAGASIVWGVVISDDLFASAPQQRTELQQPQAPTACPAASWPSGSPADRPSGREIENSARVAAHGRAGQGSAFLGIGG